MMGLDDLSTRQKVALAFTVPASLFLLYLLFRKRDDEEEYKPSKDLATGQFLMIEMKVPYKMVGTVIGREGSKIKQIQEESGARVRFQDETGLNEEEDRIVVIRGNPDNCMLAEQLLNKLISDQPTMHTVQMDVPQRAVGRVIGRGGENIRQICRCSKAKVNIDRNDGNRDPNSLRLCIIKGTLEQIKCAQAMINEELEKENEYQQKLESAMMNRRQRRPQRNNPSDDNRNAQTQSQGNPGQGSWRSVEGSIQPHMQPTEASSKNGIEEERDHIPASPSAAAINNSPDHVNVMQLPTHPNFFTVYVSAVEHPGHFWFQIITPKARQFDLLVETMTEFYRQKQNKEQFKPDCLSTGDIVAAVFEGDDLWYRAKVLGFLEDNKLDVYYVDYGDSGQVDRDTVYNLRADYLGLPYQAVEASLHGATPTGDEWCEDACDIFEESAHCAQWRPIMARIVSYNEISQPCVELIDTNGTKDKNLLEELVEHGFAQPPTANRGAGTPTQPRVRTQPSPNPPSSPLRTMESAGLQNQTSPSHQKGDRYQRNNSYQGGTG